MYQKLYFTFEMQPNIFLKIFLVSYAFTGCNLREAQFNVSVSNLIIVFASIFHQSQVNGQWKRIIRSQLVQAHVQCDHETAVGRVRQTTAIHC